MLSWQNLRDQFGQEYRNTKNFKKEFRHVLHQVKVVYPDAGIEETPGGLILHESRPPLSKTSSIQNSSQSHPMDPGKPKEHAVEVSPLRRETTDQEGPFIAVAII